MTSVTVTGRRDDISLASRLNGLQVFVSSLPMPAAATSERDLCGTITSAALADSGESVTLFHTFRVYQQIQFYIDRQSDFEALKSGSFTGLICLLRIVSLLSLYLQISRMRSSAKTDLSGADT